MAQLQLLRSSNVTLSTDGLAVEVEWVRAIRILMSPTGPFVQAL